MPWPASRDDAGPARVLTACHHPPPAMSLRAQALGVRANWDPSLSRPAPILRMAVIAIVTSISTWSTRPSRRTRCSPAVDSDGTLGLPGHPFTAQHQTRTGSTYPRRAASSQSSTSSACAPTSDQGWPGRAQALTRSRAVPRAGPSGRPERPSASAPRRLGPDPDRGRCSDATQSCSVCM